MTDHDPIAVEEGANGQTFENLEVWQDAVELAALVYETFRRCPDLDLKRQIRSAAVSISSNIAEGYERSSNQEFIRFLDIARGSCGEVRSQTLVALRVRLLDREQSLPVSEGARLLSKRIGALINVRRGKFG